MILGKGDARTEDEINQEYEELLIRQGYSSHVFETFLNVPSQMKNRIGKPLSDWEDDDVLRILENGTKYMRYRYGSYLSFLFFRGYRKASIYLLSNLTTFLSRRHVSELKPIRERFEETNSELKYAENSFDGRAFNKLIWLLAVVGKPLESINRRDFESFNNEYQKWYKTSGKNDGTRIDPAMARLERILLHWGILQPIRKKTTHEEIIEGVKHKHTRKAILDYLYWYEVKSSAKSVWTRREGLVRFFTWFQETYPNRDQLDQINREVALAYLHHLKKLVEEKKYSIKYISDMYRHIRLLFDFLIYEKTATTLNRNPFRNIDVPKIYDKLPRYIPDHELRKVIEFCNNGASLKEKTVVTVLLHTGIRGFELAKLCTTDIVQIQGVWKLHIREGKGLKDRLIPLTKTCYGVLQEWLEYGWEGINERLFTWHGIPWRDGRNVGFVIRDLRRKIGIQDLTPHRFRHTFAAALLNHGLRESALQKLLGHSTLGMTLEYGRILDKTVEMDFNQAVENMKDYPLGSVPNFFEQEDYKPFEEADAINWIRLPHGYCRRHPKLHCEADVKCLLCDRYCAHSENLECLEGMHKRYLELNMPVQADVVYSHIENLKILPESKMKRVPEKIAAVS